MWKSFLIIVFGFVLYHFIQHHLLSPSLKRNVKNKHHEKRQEILLDIEKKKKHLSPKERRKMEKELTEYFHFITSSSYEKPIPENNILL